jgi:hypothetical protein
MPYPDLPANTDDKDIMANGVDDRGAEGVTVVTGFRFATEVYMTMNQIVAVDISYGVGSMPWTQQKDMFKNALFAAKDILTRLPTELQLLPPGQAEAGELNHHLESLEPSQGVTLSNEMRNAIKNNPARRRQMQCEIQKANIFLSQLATRSYYVELYFTRRAEHFAELEDLMDTGAEDATREQEQKDETDVYALMVQERDTVIQDLQSVLATIHQLDLEPNGGSLINKIRQIASTLVTRATGNPSMQETLNDLVKTSMKLERMGTTRGRDGSSAVTAADEEEELQNWADLRGQMLRFINQGGFAGSL